MKANAWRSMADIPRSSKYQRRAFKDAVQRDEAEAEVQTQETTVAVDIEEQDLTH